MPDKIVTFGKAEAFMNVTGYVKSASHLRQMLLTLRMVTLYCIPAYNNPLP